MHVQHRRVTGASHKKRHIQGKPYETRDRVNRRPGDT